MKREWTKVITLLHQYACIQTGVRITASHLPMKGKRTVLFSTLSNRTVRDNVLNIYGAKALSSLMAFDAQLNLKPTISSSFSTLTSAPAGDASDPSSSASIKKVRVRGWVSRPAHGEGRSSPDRQMFYINGRPCGLPQFARVFTDVYRSYNVSQSPFILADIQLDTALYDVNVSPDKKTILLHDQGPMLEGLRESLTTLFEGHGYAVPINSSTSQTAMIQAQTQHPALPPPPPPPASPQPAIAEPRKFTQRTRALLSLDPSGSSAISTRSTTSSEAVVLCDDHVTIGTAENDQPAVRNDSDDEDQGDPSVQPRRTAAKESSEASLAVFSAASSSRTGHMASIPVPAAQAAARSTAFDFMMSNRAALLPGAPRSTRPHGRTLTTVVPWSPSSTDRRSLTRPREDTVRDSDDSDVEREDGHVRKRLRKAPCEDDFGSAESNTIRRSNGDCENTNLTRSSRRGTASLCDSSPLVSRPNHKNGQDGKRQYKDWLPFNPNTSTMHLSRELVTSEALIRASIATWQRSLWSDADKETLGGTATHAADVSSEDRLTLILNKGDFGRMRIVGQFNDGFVLVVRPQPAPQAPGDSDSSPGSQSQQQQQLHDELFAIDQHASDEKYNFERLQASTILQPQRLVISQRLDLTAVEEDIVLNNMHAIEANGFRIAVDDPKPVVAVDSDGHSHNSSNKHGSDQDCENATSTKHYVAGSRCRLTALPMSKDTVFGLDDLDELIHLLSEHSLGEVVPRPSSVRKMFAMRACRSSVMIGKTLTLGQMRKLVSHMGELDKPWNCPHGRPTIRHMATLRNMESLLWQEPGLDQESSNAQSVEVEKSGEDAGGESVGEEGKADGDDHNEEYGSGEESKEDEEMLLVE